MQVINDSTENVRPCPYRTNFLKYKTYLANLNEPKETELTKTSANYGGVKFGKLETVLTVPTYI